MTGTGARLTVIAAAALVAAMGAGPVTASSAPDPIDEVTHAKVALVEFLLNHLDRPTDITEPCPTLPAATATQLLGDLGLVGSSREYGVAVVFTADVGGGLASVRCGVDIARSAEPAGSVAVSTDTTVLDGQASFDQYAVALAGNDATISTVDDPPGGQVVQRCTNGGRDCTTALHRDGLVVTTRLRGLPADTASQLAVQFTIDAAGGITADLAATDAADG